VTDGRTDSAACLKRALAQLSGARQERTMYHHYKHCKKIIKFKASQLLNELPTQLLKTITSPNTFKRQLKSYLINKLNTK